MNRKPSKSSSKSLCAAAVAIVALTSAVNPAGAQSRAHRAESSRLVALYESATPGSPAQFRLHEELDRLAVEDTTPPSAADYRIAQEQT